MRIGRRDYVSLDQAKLLKELGFDYDVTSCYSALKEQLYTSIPHTNYNDPNENDFFGEDGEMFGGLGQKPYSAPMLIEVQEWLRKEKNIIIEVELIYCEMKPYFIGSIHIIGSRTETYKKEYETYEDALSAMINICLMILKTE